MKKILLSTVALLGLTVAATAADLPRRSVAPAPVPMLPVVPVFTWTGFYVGVNAGYGFNTNSNDDVVYFPGTSTAIYAGDNNNDGGFVGGAQAGYNIQFGSFVAGIEADIQYADFGRDRNDFALVAGQRYYYFGGARDLEWFGTVRARLGVAFDRVLVYATGGFAYGEGNNNGGWGAIPALNGFYANNDDIRTGWTVGGGVEYAITNNLTVKLEGLYVNLGDNGNSFYYDAVTNTVINANRSKDTDFAVVRAGLNFKF